MSYYRRRSLRVAGSVLYLALLTAGGCHLGEPTNPSFNVTRQQARRAIDLMQAEPEPLDRPVLVLSGWLDPGLAAGALIQHIESVTGEGQPIVGVSFLGAESLDECRAQVMAAVHKKLPATARADDPQPVDIVAFSMGGLVARHAARVAVRKGDLTQSGAANALPIKRIFTISTPHQGATLANLPTPDPIVWQMKPGSNFLKALNAGFEEAEYELIPYVRLGDGIVGSAHAAPPGHWTWWLPTPLAGTAHLGAYNDPRIIADIARRLRGEPSFTNPPPARLPKQYRAR